MWDYYSYASRDAGIGHVSTHVLRHTYRSWLDAAGTSIAVQQKMMRHADIRTTLNIYGDVVTDEMAQAGTKIARFAILAFLWFYRRYALFSGPVVGTTVLIVALYATIGFLIARLIGGTWRTALLVFALASWILSGDVALRLFSIGQR